MTALGEILTPSPEKLATKAIKSTRSRVANLKELLPSIKSAEELIEKIEEYITRTLGAVRADPPTDERISELRARNASDEWLYPTRGISSEITVTRRGRFTAGTVAAEISIIGDTIADIRISGDFFGELPIEALEEHLRGVKINSIHEAIDERLVGECIKGMSTDELLSLIK